MKLCQDVSRVWKRLMAPQNIIANKCIPQIQSMRYFSYDKTKEYNEECENNDRNNNNNNNNENNENNKNEQSENENTDNEEINDEEMKEYVMDVQFDNMIHGVFTRHD